MSCDRAAFVELMVVGVSVQSRLRRRRLCAAVVLVVAAGVAAAALILAGAIALPASAWFPAGALGGAASADQRVPTPEILEWRHLDHGELGSTWLLADDDAGGPDWRPGVAVTCSVAELAMWAFFGPYPADGSPVQFAVRTADGRVERHGPVIRGGPGDGFHDAMVPARGDILRMVGAATATGSLISNGYYSFWNRASPRDNEAVGLFAHGVAVRRPFRIRGCARGWPARRGPPRGAPEAGRRRPAESARNSPRDRFRTVGEPLGGRSAWPPKPTRGQGRSRVGAASEIVVQSRGAVGRRRALRCARPRPTGRFPPRR